MGEANRRRSATAQLIEAFPDCAFCGGTRKSATREHMPPKAIFDASHRPDRLVMPACQECNSGTSTADLVVSIISRWRFGEASQAEREDHRRLFVRLQKQAPAIADEWLKGTDNQDGARRHLSKFIRLPAEGGFTTIGPETVRQLNLFAHKLTLGLFFNEHQKPLPKEGCLWAFWKTKEDVMYSGLPEDMLRIVPAFGALVQGKWDTRETFTYRHGRDEREGTFACMAKMRGGLVVGGFAVADAGAFDEAPSSWTSPGDLLRETQTDRFTRRDVEHEGILERGDPNP